MLVLRRLSVSLGFSSKSDSPAYPRSRSADTRRRRPASPDRAALSESESAAPAPVASTSRRRLVKKKRKHRNDDDDDARGREPRLPDVALDDTEVFHPVQAPRTPAFALQKRVPPPPITDFPSAPSPVSHDSFLALNPTPPTTNPLGYGPLGVIHEQDERSVRSGPGSVSAWSTMLGAEREMLLRPAAPSPPGSVRDEHGPFYMFPGAAAHDTSSAATASPRLSADAPRAAHRSLEIDDVHNPVAKDLPAVPDDVNPPSDDPALPDSVDTALPASEAENSHVFPISPPTPPHTSTPPLPPPPLQDQDVLPSQPIAPFPTRPLRPHPFLEGLAGERMGGRVSRKPVPGAADVPVDVRENEDGEDESESEYERGGSDVGEHAPEHHTHQDEESGDVRPLDHSQQSGVEDENTAYMHHDMSPGVEYHTAFGDEDAVDREDTAQEPDVAEQWRDEDREREIAQEPGVSRSGSNAESWGEAMVQERDMPRRYSGDDEDRRSWDAEGFARGHEMAQAHPPHDHPAVLHPGDAYSRPAEPLRPAWAPHPIMPLPLAPQPFSPAPLLPPGLAPPPPSAHSHPHPYAHARAPPSPASVPLPLSPTYPPAPAASPPLPPLPASPRPPTAYNNTAPATYPSSADAPLPPSSYNPPSRSASLTRSPAPPTPSHTAPTPIRTASLTRRNVLRKRPPVPPAGEPRFSIVSPAPLDYTVEPWRRERPQSYHGHSSAVMEPAEEAPHAASHHGHGSAVARGEEGGEAEEVMRVDMDAPSQRRVSRKLSKKRRTPH